MLEALTARLREGDPRMLALLLRGSYARGAAGPDSDLDLLVLHEAEPDVSYRSLLLEQDNGRLLHVTIGYQALDEWLAEVATPQEAESWSLFLPVCDTASLLWADPALASRLPASLDVHYALSPQLQDMLECTGKLRNCYATGDELGVRLAAQGMALRCPALLASIHDVSEVPTTLQALRSALEMQVDIAEYRAHMELCLGLSGHATSIDDIYTTGMRLACAVLEYIRPHAQRLVGLVEPGLAEALADGSLMRLVTG